MIKIFRKIRQNLILEGKTANYIKYAIGEIVLVVIGILIALSINNWNENRKSVQIGKTYINEIYKDLQKDIVILNEVLDRLNEQSEAAENILNIFDTPGHPITDTLQFSKDYSLSSWPLIVEREPNTYSDLITKGKSNIINNTILIELLHEFYKNYDSKISNFNEFPKTVRFDKRAISMQLGTMSDFKFYIKNQYISNEYIKKMLENEEFYALTLGIYKSCYYNIGFFEEVLVQAKNILTYIEDHHHDQIF